VREGAPEKSGALFIFGTRVALRPVMTERQTLVEQFTKYAMTLVVRYPDAWEEIEEILEDLQEAEERLHGDFPVGIHLH
jgi:hypothetical protein